MIELAYPSRVLVGDWLRTLCGLAIGLGVLIFVPWTLWILLIFGALTLLFGYFGLRTLERQLQRIAFGEEGLIVQDWRRRLIPWSELSQLRLRFYGTRRQHRRMKEGEDPTGGFLEMRLAGGRTRVTFDSALPGFALLAWRAARAARERRLGLDPVTAGNLLTLGVDPDQDTSPPEMAAEWSDAIARP